MTPAELETKIVTLREHIRQLTIKIQQENPVLRQLAGRLEIYDEWRAAISQAPVLHTADPAGADTSE